MEINTIEDCFRLRLLRKVNPDKEKAKRSIELSEENLLEAQNLIKSGIMKYTIISSYMAMFHCARALLYLDGIQEKNHYAVFIYLREKYSKEISLHILNIFNVNRIDRHEALYGFDFSHDKGDAEISISDSLSFIKELKKIIEKRMSGFGMFKEIGSFGEEDKAKGQFEKKKRF